MYTRMLTETQIKRLVPTEKDQLFSLGDCLYLRFRPTGRKTFIIRRRYGAKMTSTTIGDWPEWTIQRARAKALAPDKPLAERITFGVAAGRFIEEMLEARYRGDTTRSAANRFRETTNCSGMAESSLRHNQ